jgi:hypothetical protein
VSTAAPPVTQTRRNRRSLVVGGAIVTAVAVFFVVSRSPSSRSVAGSERQLRSGFLSPLRDAGLSTEVVDACHYERQAADEPWHLAVKFAVDASLPEVVRVLDEQVVVVADRDQPIVQQYKGQPQRGWNGIVTTSGNRTLVELVKNNVHTSDSSIGVAWLPVCAEMRSATS